MTPTVPNLKTDYLAAGSPTTSVPRRAAGRLPRVPASWSSGRADRELDDLFAAARPGEGSRTALTAHLRTDTPRHSRSTT